MVLVWAVVGMVYFDKFVPPFQFLVKWFMPWKMLYVTLSEPTIERRLDFMQGLLDASRVVATASFVLMAVAFLSLSMYATFVYQQRQRRSRENRLLEMKNREISRRNEFIRFISATISHEFKNNLSRIKRRMDLVEFPAESRSRLYGNLDKLFLDIDVFKRISDEREAGLVEFEQVDLRAMFQSFSGHYEDLVRIDMEGMECVPLIFASRTLLWTVFENLIDNAVKYKKPGQERAEVSIACEEEFDRGRRYLTISFRDNGMGMDDEQADRCFYKGRGDKADSWGEGLYFAKYVIGLHAGRIKVGKEFTAPGKGTEIIINLPLVEEAVDV